MLHEPRGVGWVGVTSWHIQAGTCKEISFHTLHPEGLCYRGEGNRHRHREGGRGIRNSRFELIVVMNFGVRWAWSKIPWSTSSARLSNRGLLTGGRALQKASRDVWVSENVFRSIGSPLLWPHCCTNMAFAPQLHVSEPLLWARITWCEECKHFAKERRLFRDAVMHQGDFFFSFLRALPAVGVHFGKVWHVGWIVLNPIVSNKHQCNINHRVTLTKSYRNQEQEKQVKFAYNAKAMLFRLMRFKKKKTGNQHRTLLCLDTLIPGAVYTVERQR